MSTWHSLNEFKEMKDHEPLVDKQSLPTCHRMGSDDGMDGFQLLTLVFGVTSRLVERQAFLLLSFHELVTYVNSCEA